MAKIGVEPSEIMASVAMLMKPSDLLKYSKDANGLIKFLKEGEKIAKSDKVVYADGTKDKFLKAFDINDKDFLIAAAQGISAANSIREWAPVRSRESGTPITASQMPIKVFLTGDSWPEEVKKFQIAAYGFQSYNSSDLIIQWRNPKGLSFYGVSLKKKPLVTSGDPPLINKAFDTILSSDSPKELKTMGQIKKQVEQARIKYFARVVREATKRPNQYLKIKKGSLPANDEQLMKIKLSGEAKTASGKLIFKSKDPMFLINIKGKGDIDLINPTKQTDPNVFQIFDKSNKKYREFKPGELKNENLSMRAFVNRRVASKDSVYAAMVPVINKYSEQFAAALLNLILKHKLYKELDEHSFAFSLVTAVGDIDKDGNPKIGHIPAKGLYTVMCGLSALNKSNTKYKMVLDEKANKDSDGARVFFNLKKGKLNVLSLLLRYKGSFAQQPQFQATLTPEFKEILKEQWGKKCKVY